MSLLIQFAVKEFPSLSLNSQHSNAPSPSTMCAMKCRGYTISESTYRRQRRRRTEKKGKNVTKNPQPFSLSLVRKKGMWIEFSVWLIDALGHLTKVIFRSLRSSSLHWKSRVRFQHVPRCNSSDSTVGPVLSAVWFLILKIAFSSSSEAISHAIHRCLRFDFQFSIAVVSSLSLAIVRHLWNSDMANQIASSYHMADETKVQQTSPSIHLQLALALSLGRILMDYFCNSSFHYMVHGSRVHENDENKQFVIGCYFCRDERGGEREVFACCHIDTRHHSTTAL